MKILLPLSAACWVLPAQAAVIAQYNFTGGSLTSSDSDTNSTADLFSIDISGSAGTSASGGDVVFVRADATAGGEAGAIILDNYFSFMVTPEAGYQINLDTLSFDAMFDVFESTVIGDQEATWFVRTSTDSFASTVASRDPVIGPNVTTTPLETIDPLIDMSGVGPLTSATEIRLYVYDNRDDTAVQRLDNVILTGDAVLIPEPSTLWMVALGLGAVAVLKRRR